MAHQWYAALTWFPRVLAIVFALFISVFALDSFEGHASFLEKLGHLLVHLIPTALVVGALIVAWRYRIIGGLVFMMLGMAFTIHFGTWKEPELFLLFSVPLFVTGLCFIFSRYSQLNTTK
ncbi:MAG: hypothetical protein JNN28_17270 [Saprospiraceae bacterium]|nr:hypothetical protein [Saprospiraceae bacterium]